MEPLSEAEWAYLAGIIDGEGSISLDRNRADTAIVRPLVSIDSTDIEIIEWLHSRLGGSRTKKTRYADHHKQAWTWRAKDSRALGILVAVLPYLVIERKRRRARLLVDEFRALTPRNGRYTPDGRAAKLDFIERFFSP